MPETASTTYDQIPYPSYCFPQTHPDRLAAVATLLGLTPAPVERCRVLELGSAAGSNLIPMAEALPDSRFVGVDLSQRQVDEGRKAIAELGLNNIELRHQSILDVRAGAETYDFIICHGVYSWVPPEVQERILAICRQSLDANGVAYVSYNTLPGWHMRGMIRDMMLYHGQRFPDPRQKVAQARGLLDFLVSSINMEQNPYGQYLRSELELIRRQPDSYLLHDHLEEHNTPLYFHQFVERAAAHRLRYLADTELSTMEFSHFPKQVGQVLQRIGSDLVQVEQYLDFLRNRTFRQTLLCHTEREVKYRLDPAILTPFFVGSAVRPISPQPNLRGSTQEQFQAPSGASAISIHPIVKAAMVVLSEEWPQMVSFPQLCSRARAKLQEGAVPDAAASAEDERVLGQALLQFYTTASGLVEFRLRPLRMTTQAGSQPLVRPLARWQARSAWQVTNLRHEPITLNAFAREVLLRLDGQCPRSNLVRQLTGLVEGGQLNIQQNGEKISDPQRVKPVLLHSLEQQLVQFARQSLLLA